ncbi:hypothetical protein [Nocardioides mangrovi]|uniref:Uncharacterized protein n=1 Tax=Nocardioides mangrovi TaxID=2874580 RepID=A0ABS7UHZ2_9ACTN|nr:hypothetical protein [Nocardioides mangrovi]MBZ5740286.1 hypothetical protein [Nocardioides mangrovi]
MSRLWAGGAIGAAAVVAAVVGAGLGIGDDVDDAEALEGAQPIPFDVYVEPGGLRLGIDPVLAETSLLTGGSVALGDEVERGLHFASSTYEEPGPDPFPVAAHTRVSAEGWIHPRCEVRDLVPVLTVESRGAGRDAVSATYRPSNLDDYRRAVDAFCGQGPEVAVVGSRQDVDGSFTVTLRVVNPTDRAVWVVSEAFREGGTRWDVASATVQAGGATELVVSGRGEGCSAVTPWSTGRLTVDGVALVLEPSDAEQC